MVTITDNRIEEGTPVARENIQVSLTTVQATVIHTINNDGQPEDITLNVVVPDGDTTLKDIEADISNLQIEEDTTQAQLTTIQNSLRTKIATREEIVSTIDTAISSQEEVADSQIEVSSDEEKSV